MICHESFIKIIREHKTRTKLFRDLEHSEKIRLLFSDSLTPSPDAPANLSLTPGDNTIDASVDAYSGATAYNWYLDSVLIQSTAGPTFQFSGLINEQEYDVFTTVTTLGIESKATAIQQATPTDVVAPAAPTNLVATPGDGIVDLDWDDNVEPDLAYYNVYQDSVEIATNVLVSNFQVTGLTNGQSYDFEVTAVDDADNESALSNTASATPVAPALNKNVSSLSFDGVDDFVDTNSFYSGITNFTISCFVKLNSIPSSGFYALCGQGFLVTDEGFGLIVTSSGKARFQTRMPSGTSINLDSTTTLETDKWYHIVGVHDRGTSENRIYINGVEENSIGFSYSGSFDTSENFSIGARLLSTSSTSFYADAFIDEVQLWDKVLSRSEIVQNGNNILSGNETNLVGYWNVEDRNPSQLTDLTSNANHGTISGASYAYDGFDFDYSLSFDGVNDYLEIPNDVVGGLNTTTIEAEFKITDFTNNNQGIIAYYDNLDSERSILFRVNNSGDLQFFFFNESHVQQGGTLSSGAISLNTRYKVSITYDGSTIKGFINGVPTSTISATGAINTPNPILNIGGRPENNSSANWFEGIIDKVAIWDIARTAEEIQQNLNKELEGDESGLVGYWKFDDLSDLGVAVDSSPSGNDGTINGATYSTDILSYYQGVSFDGVDDYVEIANAPELQLGSVFTIELYVKRNATGEIDRLLWKRDNDGVNNGYALFINSSNELQLTFFGVAGYTSTTTITDTNWHHIAIVLDAGVIQFYIDGIDAGSQAVGSITNNTESLYIGATYTADTQTLVEFSDQLIDEFRVWSVAKTQQEIQDNMDAGLQGNETGLTALYPMNEGVGGVAYDKTSNNNNGTINGAVFTEEVGVKV